MATALAIDLGSSSGRVLAGRLTNGVIEVTQIHRFAHEAQQTESGLVWDIENLIAQSISGLRLALDRFPDAVSVSVDTWGVDFVTLDASHNLVGPVRAYRDQRTTRTLGRFKDMVDDRDFFALSGVAPAFINSANQLVALNLEQPELAERIEKVLWLADYVSWRLSGVMGWSRSLVATGGLCQPGGGSWSSELLNRLGLPRRWFGELDNELSVIGPCILPGLEQLQVVRGGSHDSACAVHALPIERRGSYFLSCGSWAVVGTLVDQPLISELAFELGVSNEIRTDGGIRPLFNLTGLWILQECQRQWSAEGESTDIAALVDEARNADSLGALINVDDPVFVPPGNMPGRIRAVLGKQVIEQASRGQLIRTVLESFAIRYARAVNDLAQLARDQVAQLHIVGGGSRNSLLCELIARATNVPVLAGPAEAATFGSMIAQFETLGYLDETQRAEVISASTSTTRYQPEDGK